MRRQFASLHWHACTSDWIHLCNQLILPVVPPSSPYLNALESVARAALSPAVADDALDGLHLVLVLDELVAGIAQVEIVAGAAVPLGLAGALVARVVHFVRVRLVQGVAQTQSRVFGTSEN